MNKFTIASFLKVLKKYSNNPKINDPDFVNKCFSCIVKTKKVTNKNLDLFEFSSSRTSELLHNDISVPIAILNELEDCNLINHIRKSFYDFLKNDFNEIMLYTIAEEMMKLLNNDESFPNEIIKDLEKNLDNPSETILLIFIESLKIDNIHKSETNMVVWERGNSNIKVISGDIFKYGFTKKKKNKNIIVIPVDTSFSTKISDNLENDLYPLVSTETLHGMWISRCLNSGILLDDLRLRIDKYLSLNKIEFEKLNARKNYPIGTTVSLEINNSVYYLLACSKFDENNQARSNIENIKYALISLLKHYDQCGQGYKIYIPLIGTGRSRVNLSYKESLNLIINTFIENKDYIQGEIKIVVLPEVYEKIGGHDDL